MKDGDMSPCAAIDLADTGLCLITYGCLPGLMAREAIAEEVREQHLQDLRERFSP